MNRNNIKILNKLNNLIDEQVENGLNDTSLIKKCLAYIANNKYFFYCPMSKPELFKCLSLRELDDNEIDIDIDDHDDPYYAGSDSTYYKALPNGIRIYNDLQLDNYNVFVEEMGKDSYLSLCTQPFEKSDNIQGPLYYIEVDFSEIMENIDFNQHEINGIAIETDNSTYYLDIEEVEDIIDNHDELAAKFAEGLSPKIGVWSGSILDPVMINAPVVRISTDKQIIDKDTSVLDLDDDYDTIRHNLIDLLESSKEFYGPDVVCIQLPHSIEYSDVISKLFKTVHDYLEDIDNYYLLINFITKDRYYLGYINALIHSYYDGYDITDFYNDEYLNNQQPTEKLKAS